MRGAGSAHLWLALLVLGAPPQQAQELVRDGDFATHSNKVTAGQYMSEFPGFKNTALAVFPGSSPIVVLSDAAVKTSRGWYRVRFFAHALHGYGEHVPKARRRRGLLRLRPVQLRPGRHGDAVSLFETSRAVSQGEKPAPPLSH